jgi:GxxExxY protein
MSSTPDPYVKPEYEHSDLTSRILAAAIQVHRGLGPGFEEVIYQRALALELQAQGLEYAREVWIEIHYREKNVGRKRVDFLIEGVMVEIKACAELQDVHFVQALSYLKASGCKIGLLLNFGASRLEIKRLAN